MPRTGRPPAQDPKNNRITVRFNAELFQKLNIYCKSKGIEKAEAIRVAVEKMLDESQ